MSSSLITAFCILPFSLKSPEATATKGITRPPSTSTLVHGETQSGDHLFSLTQSVPHLGINAVADADFNVNRLGFGIFIRLVRQHVHRARHQMLAVRSGTVTAWTVPSFHSGAVAT